MPEQTIHELKAGLSPQKPDDPQPEPDAMTRSLFTDVSPSMVKIKVDNGSGSGFVVTKDGDVATDSHVVLGNRHISVITADGVEHKARLTKLDDINDLAILHIEGCLPKDLKPVHFGSSKALQADQSLWAFGHPKGWDPLYVAPGYFRRAETGQDVLDAESQDVRDHASKLTSAMTPKEKQEANADLKRPMLNASVNIQHGISGGALFNQDGDLVGIADLSNMDSNSDFTPVESLIALMNDTNPKFQFKYKVSGSELTLIDITRTSGEYRRPFLDNLIVMNDSHTDSPPINPKQLDLPAGMVMERMN
jgi:S1-C subfamily serine protease